MKLKRILLPLSLGIFIVAISAVAFQKSETQLLKGQIDWQSIIQARDPDLARFQQILKRCLEPEPTLPFDYRSCPNEVATGLPEQNCKDDTNTNKNALISGLLGNGSTGLGTPLTWKKLKKLKGVDMTVGFQTGIDAFNTESVDVFFDFGDKKQDYQNDLNSLNYIVAGSHDLECSWSRSATPLPSPSGSFAQSVNRNAAIGWPISYDRDYVATVILQGTRNPNPTPFTEGFSYSFHNGANFEGYLFRYQDINGVSLYDFTWPEKIVRKFKSDLDEIETLLSGQTATTQDGYVEYEYFPPR